MDDNGCAPYDRLLKRQNKVGFAEGSKYVCVCFEVCESLSIIIVAAVEGSKYVFLLFEVCESLPITIVAATLHSLNIRKISSIKEAQLRRWRNLNADRN
ncbi:hypothetical protein PIB30_047683 [Stylosanthes scabra]|uniref:Uncharacterized protein n=1 Tax=Stylosanthes scabra TaxID=79078 RepID=A0ABU6ZFM5_9FABA|nr:hypothetical protein [Stylosanthes scabra]